ncbi:histidine kinase [Algoriphagus sp. H41]|uniref:Histidine kinase n=1 Tax=Algoriphagus oliviformis TaxID=2811231 RepID=A0ABS3BXP8_9BACT|nr:sensor histidine kinase [Algoriphagus oliviformis]MBN7809647.1 histidine kinase [Algoriphagus oliviformis]
MTATTVDPACRGQSDFWYDTKKFILINLGIALSLQLVFCAPCFLSWEGIKGMVPDFLFSFTISSLLSFGGSRVEHFLDARMSWVHSPVRRLLLTTGLYLAYAFAVSFVVVFVYYWLLTRFSLDQIPWDYLLRFSLTPMYIALVFMAIFTSRSWLLEWRKSAIEAEQLRSEKLASQNQSLKDQLNPHFLFNSLNTLSNLVYEDADRSAAFIQKLSRIYRYVLEVQQEELVSLDRELDFARNFLELQKIRFGENLNFAIKVPSPQGFFLPPLSLQLLLENAIKHNIASTDNPLFIHILQKEGELWISNTFQPKSSQSEPSTGVGLNNIRSRYLLLSKAQPEVIQAEHEYLVKLPLLILQQ